MKQKFTNRIYAGLCLLFLLLGQNVRAQFPKLLNSYPVIAEGPTAINALGQKGNVMFLGGSFTGLGKPPIKNGFEFDHIGDNLPNTNFVSPDQPINFTVGDGAGGFYIGGGNITTVGGIGREKLARINADGSLNTTFNPTAFVSDDPGSTLQGLAMAGNNLIVSGYFTQIGDQSYTQPLAALDGTTGQPLSGWNDLQIPSIYLKKIIVNGNKLYVLGWDVDFNQKLLVVVDITDITHPSLISSFKVDAQGSDGQALSIIDMAVSGNVLFLSGWQKITDGNFTYQNKTLSGQSFNSALFAIDATTGNFIKAFPTSLIDQDRAASIALDGNKLYFAYHSGATANIMVYDTETGADVSSTLPPFSITGLQVGVSNDVPLRNFNRLLVTADHNLIIYGGITQLNGKKQSIAAINLAANTLADWNPDFTGSFPVVSESNGRIYMGGDVSFNGQVPRSGLAAINASTGELLPWASNLTGTFNAITIYNNNLYVGGKFTGPSGLKNLALFDISDPNNPVLKTDWNPNPDNSINALALNEDKLYVSGSFLNISGQSQTRLAEYDISSGTGTLNTTWNPAPDGDVNALTILKDKLYIGGRFLNIGETARNYSAAFDLNNKNITAWDPMIGTGGSVSALCSQPADGTNHADRIFIGGYYNSIGINNDPAAGIVAVNTTDGAQDLWQLSGGFSGNGVQSLAIGNNKLYAGGNFLNSADASGNFGGVDADVYLNQATVNSILPSGNLLFVGGGDFIGPNGESLKGLAVFQTGDIDPMITFTDLAKTYGNDSFSPGASSTVADKPITYSIADGDNPDNVITLADGKITIVKPGIATVTASQSGAPDVKAKITINKAELTIHPKDATIVVNQPLTDFPFTITGWKLEDETKPGIYNGKPEFATTATSGSPAGTYEISVSGIGTLLSDYYTFAPSSTDKATLTINTTGSTTQTITFAALPAKTYGEADFEAGAATDGSGLTISYSSSDENIATITNGKIHLAGAGTVTITASQHGDPTYAPATDVMQTFTIAKAPLTITADDKIKDRGTANPAFTATYAGLVNGDKATNLTTVPAFSTTATATSKPGTYPITVADASSNNYNITYVNGTLTIRGTQIITWAPLSTLTYGDASFNPGAVSDADAKLKPVYTTSNPSIISISGAQAIIKGAGTATITATFAAANGFDLTTATLPVTILKKQLVVTAQDKSRNYGEPNPVLTYTFNGFVNADNATSGALTVQPVASTTATATSPTGVYPVTITGATSNNYDIVYVGANLTVNAVERTLTFAAIANKTYGNADFDAAASSNTGEIPAYTSSNADVATVLDGKIHITGAGTVQITAALPPNPGYTGTTTVTQTLTVAKAPLIITADNKTKSQGPPDILLTATYSGFAGTDNQLNLTTRPVLTTTAKTNSPTGTYPITISGASSPNYEITYQPGILTIVLGIGQEDVIVNQALSPNGDGLNDYFQINGINNFPDNHVAIINRNGQKVYEVNGYDNATRAFTGKSSQDGNVLQQGTYFYRIEYKLNGQQVRKSGYLVLKY